MPGWGAFPDASDLQAWLQAKQDAAAAVQLQQQLGSSLPKGGSVHRVLVEDDGAAAGNQQQQQQGRLRWVVLYITMPKGGKPQVGNAAGGEPFVLVLPVDNLLLVSSVRLKENLSTGFCRRGKGSCECCSNRVACDGWYCKMPKGGKPQVSDTDRGGGGGQGGSPY